MSLMIARLSLRMSYYAVAKGRTPGIFRSWDECETQVKGFSGAVFKKFKSNQEALDFISKQPKTNKRPRNELQKPKQSFAETFKKLKHDPNSNELSSDEKTFLNLPEYKDEIDPSNVASSSAQQGKAPKVSVRKPVPSTSTDSEEKQTYSKKIPFQPPEETTQKSYGGFKFQEDSQGFVHVYTDGSCESNGKFTAAAGLGVYFGKNHPLNVSEPVTGRPTNNSGEIQAAIRAIQDAQKSGVKRLKIFTDSQFLIKSVCTWMSGWKQKDWKLASGRKVVNHVDFKKLDELIESGNMLIKWAYIRAHKGYHGNEEADRLAKIGASMYRTKNERKLDGSDSDDFEKYF